PSWAAPTQPADPYHAPISATAPLPVPYPPAPAYGPPGYDPYGQPNVMMVVTQPTSGAAVASLVLGILGLLVGWCACLLPNLVGIVLGHMGLSQTKDGRANGRGMAVAGLVLGYLSLVPTLIFFLLFGLGFFASVFNAGGPSS